MPEQQTDADFEIEQEAFDREFCIIAALVTASLDAFMAFGQKQGRDLPELKIASGLRDYLDELVAGMSYSHEQERLDKLADQAVESYLALAAEVPASPRPTARMLNAESAEAILGKETAE